MSVLAVTDFVLEVHPGQIDPGVARFRFTDLDAALDAMRALRRADADPRTFMNLIVHTSRNDTDAPKVILDQYVWGES